MSQRDHHRRGRGRAAKQDGRQAGRQAGKQATVESSFGPCSRTWRPVSAMQHAGDAVHNGSS
jgi:GTP cyclohydrolase III